MESISESETDFVVVAASGEETTPDLFRWDTEATRVLINVYKRNIKNIGKHPSLIKKKDLWELITNEINKLGHNLSWLQIRNRMTTLERSYNKNPGRMLVKDIDLDCGLKEIFSNKLYSNDDNLHTEYSASLTDQKESIEVDQLWENSNMNFDETEKSTIVIKSLDYMESGISDLCKWDYNTTKLLFDIYDEVNQDSALMAQLKKKNNMWNLVTEKLNEHGYIFASTQVQNRMKTIERAYRRHIGKRKYGNINLPFPFEDRILKILKNHNILSRIKPTKRIFPQDFDDISNVVLGNSASASTDCFGKATEEDNPLVKEIKLLRQEQDEFRKEMLTAQVQRFQLMEEGNALLRENNDLLRQLVIHNTGNETKLIDADNIDLNLS